MRPRQSAEPRVQYVRPGMMPPGRGIVPPDPPPILAPFGETGSCVPQPQLQPQLQLGTSTPTGTATVTAFIHPSSQAWKRARSIRSEIGAVCVHRETWPCLVCQESGGGSESRSPTVRAARRGGVALRGHAIRICKRLTDSVWWGKDEMRRATVSDRRGD